MGFAERVTNFIRPSGRKQSRAQAAVLSLGPFQAQWSGQSYEAYAREGMLGNPYVYACIRQVSMAVAGLPWNAYGDEAKEHPIDQHPLLDLLRRPNPRQAGGQFFEALVGYLLLDGNVYIERAGGNPDLAAPSTKAANAGSAGKAPPDELYLLRPDRVRVVPGDVANPVAGYVYSVGGVKAGFPEPLVRHFKLFHPSDDWYGLSPLAAATKSVDQSNQSKAWNVALLQRGAQPTGALVSAGSVETPQYLRLKDMIEEQYAGYMNAGRPIILEGGLDWKQMGMSPVDMAWLEGQKLSAREIAMVYNIAPELIGDPESKTFSNYQEARKALYQENVLPLMDWIRDELNAWLAPLYGDVYLDYDREEIEALQEDRTAVYERNNAAFIAGWLRMGDAQQAAGIEVDEWYGDYYKWQLPISSAQDPGPWETPKKPEPLPAPQPTVSITPADGTDAGPKALPPGDKGGEKGGDDAAGDTPAKGGGGDAGGGDEAKARRVPRPFRASRKARAMTPSERLGHADEVEAQRAAWAHRLLPAVRRQLEPLALAAPSDRADALAASKDTWVLFFTQLYQVVGSAFATHHLDGLVRRLGAEGIDVTSPDFTATLHHYIDAYAANTVTGRVTRLLLRLAAILERADARAPALLLATGDDQSPFTLTAREALGDEALDLPNILDDLQDELGVLTADPDPRVPGALPEPPAVASGVLTPFAAIDGDDADSLLTDLAGEIADTEVVTASGLGPMAAALAFQDFYAVTLVKTWQAMLDRQTRPSHADADGQQVEGVGEPFLVGGEQLLFPTDASLGAGPEETANCRCVIIFEPLSADKGRAATWAEQTARLVADGLDEAAWGDLLGRMETDLRAGQ